MAHFTLTITEIATYAAKGHVARIIASSPGFFFGEEEALEVLSSLPTTINFEAEREKGEEMLATLRKAGCELSYTIRNDESDDEKLRELSVCEARSRFGLAANYNDEQLDIYERRFNRIPKMLWAIALWCVAVILTSVVISPQPVIIIFSPVLVVVFASAMLAVISLKGPEGYIMTGIASVAGAIASGLLAFLALASSVRNLHILFILVSALAVCLMCVHLFFTLLKRPIREWFA